jgi:hypothetical protein
LWRHHSVWSRLDGDPAAFLLRCRRCTTSSRRSYCAQGVGTTISRRVHSLSRLKIFHSWTDLWRVNVMPQKKVGKGKRAKQSM